MDTSRMILTTRTHALRLSSLVFAVAALGAPTATGAWVDSNTTTHLGYLRATREIRATQIDAKLRPSLVTQGPVKSKKIALTFDDGPHPEYTPKILNILRKYKVKATFFMIGSKLQTQPALARQILAEGHEVANHTMHHLRLPDLSSGDMVAQWEDASTIFEEVLGVSPYLCRPPGGKYNDEVLAAANSFGMTTVLWTANSGDFGLETSSEVASAALAKAKAGGIILLHDTVDLTAEALPSILEGLKKKRLKPVPVGDLFGIQP